MEGWGCREAYVPHPQITVVLLPPRAAHRSPRVLAALALDDGGVQLLQQLVLFAAGHDRLLAHLMVRGGAAYRESSRPEALAGEILVLLLHNPT